MSNLLIDCAGYAEICLNEHSSTGATKFRGKFQEANRPNKNRRRYPKKVLNDNMEKLQETVNSRGLFGELDHPCLTSSDFRVLTVDGWKDFLDITVDDVVWSRVNGKAVKSTIKGIINKPYDGVAYNVKGRSIDCTFTPDHKFLYVGRQDYAPTASQEEKYATLKEIFNDRTKYSHCSIPKTAVWEGDEKVTHYTLVGHGRNQSDLVIEADKFAAFLGVYLAEGTFVSNQKKNSNRVTICQKNQYGKALIKNMLSGMHPELEWKECVDGFAVHDSRLWNFVSKLGDVYSKSVPQNVKDLPAKCLETLLFWFAIGDGRIQKLNVETGVAENVKETISHNDSELLSRGDYNRINVFSVSKQLISDLHECAVKAGMCGSLSTVVTTEDYQFAGRTIKAENKRPLYNLNLSRSKYIHMDARFMEIEESYHVGSIYCLMTEHGNFYMEHKGKSFWTGNCDSVIHLANASHLITKMWWEGDMLMGEGEVLGTPAGKVLKALIESGRIGMSSRGVGTGETDAEGVMVVSENFKLITFDVVADPSTMAAYQKKIGKNETFDYESIVPNRQMEAPKKTYDPKLFEVYFGETLKNRVKELKNSLKR